MGQVQLPFLNKEISLGNAVMVNKPSIPRRNIKMKV